MQVHIVIFNKWCKAVVLTKLLGYSEETLKSNFLFYAWKIVLESEALDIPFFWGQFLVRVVSVSSLLLPCLSQPPEVRNYIIHVDWHVCHQVSTLVAVTRWFCWIVLFPPASYWFWRHSENKANSLSGIFPRHRYMPLKLRGTHSFL